MARSKASFHKREKEIQRQKHRQQKIEKSQQRKSEKGGTKSLEDMLAYVDGDGNITSTPPDSQPAAPSAPDDNTQSGSSGQSEADPS